jgi:hypothetical protein
MERQASWLDGVASGSFMPYIEDKIQHSDSDDDIWEFSYNALSPCSKNP